MNDKFKLGVGQAHEIEMGMNRVGGWDESLVKILCTGDHLGLIRDVLLHRAEIKQEGYFVDLDADPMIPDSWKVEEHIKGGQFKFDPTKVELYLDEGQKNGESIEGNNLHKKLKRKNLFNANLLDFYLAHKKLIPESWKKGKVIFFWGTIYRNTGGYLYVRCLGWSGSQWRWDYHWLNTIWSSNYPAAVPSK